MRLSIAAACLVLTLPAVAAARQPAPPPGSGVSAAQVAAALQNPLVQDGVAQAVTNLAGILLDTRVGPLAAIAGSHAGIRGDDTLRDLEHRDDPQFEAHLHDRTRGAIAAAGAAAGGATAEMTELDATARRLRDALAPLLAYAGRASGDRDR